MHFDPLLALGSQGLLVAHQAGPLFEGGFELLPCVLRRLLQRLYAYRPLVGGFLKLLLLIGQHIEPGRQVGGPLLSRLDAEAHRLEGLGHRLGLLADHAEGLLELLVLVAQDIDLGHALHELHVARLDLQLGLVESLPVVLDLLLGDLLALLQLAPGPVAVDLELLDPPGAPHQLLLEGGDLAVLGLLEDFLILFELADLVSLLIRDPLRLLQVEVGPLAQRDLPGEILFELGHGLAEPCDLLFSGLDRFLIGPELEDERVQKGLPLLPSAWGPAEGLQWGDGPLPGEFFANEPLGVAPRPGDLGRVAEHIFEDPTQSARVLVLEDPPCIVGCDRLRDLGEAVGHHRKPGGQVVDDPEGSAQLPLAVAAHEIEGERGLAVSAQQLRVRLHAHDLYTLALWEALEGIELAHRGPLNRVVAAEEKQLALLRLLHGLDEEPQAPDRVLPGPEDPAAHDGDRLRLPGLGKDRRGRDRDHRDGDLVAVHAAHHEPGQGEVFLTLVGADEEVRVAEAVEVADDLPIPAGLLELELEEPRRKEVRHQGHVETGQIVDVLGVGGDDHIGADRFYKGVKGSPG